MATLADVLEAIQELIAVTEKIRENTEGIAKSDEKVDKIREKTNTLHIDMIEMGGDTKANLNMLDMKEEISALKAQLAEHIAACEKAKA